MFLFAKILYNASLIHNINEIKKYYCWWAGSIILGLLWIGYSPSEIIFLIIKEYDDIYDAMKMPYESLMYVYQKKYIVNNYKMTKFIRKKIKWKTGKSNITLQEIHDKFGIEINIFTTKLAKWAELIQ